MTTMYNVVMVTAETTQKTIKEDKVIFALGNMITFYSPKELFAYNLLTGETEFYYNGVMQGKLADKVSTYMEAL